jgi:hypothetical protein
MAAGFFGRTLTRSLSAAEAARSTELFDFGNQRGADYHGIRKTAQYGNVARKRDPEAYGNEAIP